MHTKIKAIAGIALVCSVSHAQHEHPQPASSEKPVPGLGTWTHPIATQNPEAQKYFDQGLTLLCGFNRYEARRSFQKALELDHTAVMAQWGLAMSLGPYLNMDMDPDVNVKQSCDALQSGLARPGVRAQERAWLEAAAARCPDYSQPQKYIAVMRSLAARFPDDPDAQTLFADSLLLPVRWRFYSPGGKPAEGVEEVQRVFEAVLRRYPNHPGANHFYIHAVESSPTPERGIPSAERLMSLVPSAGHMVHMPGHIWLAVGDYDAALATNVRAAQADKAYFAQTGVISSYYMIGYLHDLVFIVYARAMQGRRTETRQTIDEIRNSLAPILVVMPDMQGAFEMYIGFIEMRMGMWDNLLAAPGPKDANPVLQGMWHYRRATALLRKGRPKEARQEQTEFEQLRKNIDRNMSWGVNNNLGQVMDLAATVLEARLESDPKTAISKWRKAVEIQDRLTYFEPPAWYYPVRESLGAGAADFWRCCRR